MSESNSSESSYYRPLSLGYFLLFSAAGCVFPFMPVFFSTYAMFDEATIGTLFAAQKVVGSLSAIATGQLADMCHAHRLIFVWGVLLCTAANVGVYFVAQIEDNYLWSMTLIIITAVTGTYTPLADSFAMVAMETNEGYGSVALCLCFLLLRCSRVLR